MPTKLQELDQGTRIKQCPISENFRIKGTPPINLSFHRPPPLIFSFHRPPLPRKLSPPPQKQTMNKKRMGKNSFFQKKFKFFLASVDRPPPEVKISKLQGMEGNDKKLRFEHFGN